MQWNKTHAEILANGIVMNVNTKQAADYQVDVAMDEMLLIDAHEVWPQERHSNILKKIGARVNTYIWKAVVVVSDELQIRHSFFANVPVMMERFWIVSLIQQIGDV